VLDGGAVDEAGGVGSAVGGSEGVVEGCVGGGGALVAEAGSCVVSVVTSVT